MSLQILIPFAPFLALLYVVFALVQALRHKQQGIGAALLALIALVVPVAAYILASTAVLQALILTRLALNALIVFVASLLIGLIERRNKARTPGRSYAMLGIGLSVVFALVMFAAPLLSTSSATDATAAVNQTASQTVSRDNTLVNVSDVRNTTAEDTAAQATLAAETDSAEPPAVALVLTEQTGLTVAEITAQVQAGSTLADLVTANSGDLDAVVTAITSALDEMVASGARTGQMLNRFGSDNTEIATQLVQGELGQAQQFLLPVLLTGEMPQFGGGRGGGAPPSDGSFTPPEGFEPPNDGSFTLPEGFEPPNDNDGSFTPPGAEVTPEVDSALPPDEDASVNVVDEAEASVPNAEVTAEPSADAPVERPQRDTVAQVTPEPTATAVPLEATEPVIRPTRIAFPTTTPMPEAAESAEATDESSSTETTDDADSTSAANASTAICLLVVNYNLNVRNQPTADGSTVLISIPFGTTVNAAQVTADGWYSVSYDGTSGWVTGEYVTPSATCADLPVAS